MIKVLGIRVDASKKVGTGHLFRCIRLAENFRKIFKIVFYVKSPTQEVLTILRKNRFEYQPASSLQSVDVLLIDHYGIGHKWEKNIRKHVKKIIVIDDLANRKHDSDVLIDSNEHNIGKYDSLVPQKCIQLIGKKYVITDKSLQQRTKKIQKIRRVSIFFGGSDVKNLKTAMRKLGSEKYAKIQFDFILGMFHPGITDKTIFNRKNFSFHRQPFYYQKLLARSDLSIGASGTSALERCYMHIPSIIFKTAANQKKNYQLLQSINCAFGTEWKSFDKVFGKLIGQPSIVEKTRQNCVRHFPKTYIQNQCEILRSSLLELTKCDEDGYKFLYSLRNSKRVRQLSLNQRLISLNDHARWVQATSKEVSHLILIIHDLDGKKIGYLRYHWKEKVAKVSIAMTSNQEGKGYGAMALQLGETLALEHARKYRLKTKFFSAEIVSKNRGSIRIFTKNGFKSFKQGLYLKKPL